MVGKTRDEAATLLEAEDFARVTFAEEKSDTAEGTVLSVTPEAGEKAKASTDITVTVAVPFTVPDVANQPLDAAKAALQEASYVPEVAYYYTEDVPEGTVVGTSPAAGEKLASGSSVTVNVAMSRASVLVPAAKDYLSSIGTIALGGTTYEIVSVDDVKYTGYNQTSFTVTAAAVTTLDGETVRGSAKQKSGTIVWDDSDNVVSISYGTMASATYTARAIVLRKTKLGESDLIVTLLAQDGSQIRAVAKGARKPSSPFAARLELYSSVDLLCSKGRSLDIVKEARIAPPTSACAATWSMRPAPRPWPSSWTA